MGLQRMNPAEVQHLVRKKRYLTVKEAAELHGVKPRYLYNRVGIDRGPPYRRRNKMILFPTWEFIQWSEQPETP